MSRLSKYLLVAVLLLFALACSLINNPIQGVENAASTAQAIASGISMETVQALTTVIPVQTIEALPSLIPDIGSYFDPTGTPVDQWKGIPIMPQATVGEEFGDNTYGYTVPASALDIQSFYNKKSEELGWKSSFGLQVSEQGGILFFQIDGENIAITITPDQNDSHSKDVILQK
mgnify:CR=1 FL=1